jgi:hypothetical protein
MHSSKSLGILLDDDVKRKYGHTAAFAVATTSPNINHQKKPLSLAKV